MVAIDLGAARVAVLFADGDELFADDLHEALGTREDVGEVDDGGQQLLVFGDDLVLLEAREAVQAHVEDGLGLDLGEFVALAALARDAEFRGETLRPRGDFTGAREQLRARRPSSIRARPAPPWLPAAWAKP